MTMQAENFSMARRAFDAGDYNGALHHLQTHISSIGNVDEPIATLLGQTLLQLGLPREAGEFFEMAAEADETQAFRSHREAAFAYFRTDDTDKALLNAMKAFRLGSDPELTFVLISLLVKTNETQLVDQLKFRLLESDDPKHLDLAFELIGADRWDARTLLLMRKLRHHRPDDTVIRNAVLTLAREFCDYDTIDEEERRLPPADWLRPHLLMQETPHDNVHWCIDEAANRLALNSQTIQPIQKGATGRHRRKRKHSWGEKIRVGYLSSDFFPSHATMRLLGDVLRRHDQSRFEIVLFCTTPARLVDDPVRLAARSSWGEIVDLNGLDDAEAAIGRVKGVMGGEPVFKGTRIPVRTIAAMLAQGADEADLIEGYPSLTARMIELARIWTAAHPTRGRPKKLSDHGLKAKSSKRAALKGDPCPSTKAGVPA